MNNEIRAQEVRVIDANGEQLGILSVQMHCGSQASGSWTWWKWHQMLSHRFVGSWTMVSTSMSKVNGKRLRKRSRVITIKEVDEPQD